MNVTIRDFTLSSWIAASAFTISMPESRGLESLWAFSQAFKEVSRRNVENQ
jgi:hypothetical protein